MYVNKVKKILARSQVFRVFDSERDTDLEVIFPDNSTEEDLQDFAVVQASENEGASIVFCFWLILMKGGKSQELGKITERLKACTKEWIE